ncbi:MAG: hypothetical protein ACK4N5_22865, partial [Myxococcales bacterium]
MRLAAALALLLLTPAVASAWPVTERLDLVVGKETMVRSYAKLAAVDDPGVVEAELLPSQEVLLVPRRPGRALLFLLNDGQFDAVRVRVRETGGAVPEQRLDDGAMQAARRVCTRLEVEPASGNKAVSAEAVSARCREALLELLRADDTLARDLSLLFTEEALQAQLEDIQRRMKQQGLDREFQASYVGVTLRLKGKGSEARKLALLKT